LAEAAVPADHRPAGTHAGGLQANGFGFSGSEVEKLLMGGLWFHVLTPPPAIAPMRVMKPAGVGGFSAG
jgi:hypothetical protein